MTHLKPRDTYRLKVDNWKKTCKLRQKKKAGVAILISDKTDFEKMTMIRDKEGHYIMMKGSIQEDDIAIINICALNIKTPQHGSQMLKSMKGEINSNILSVWALIDRSTRQKISKETQALNDTMDQLDQIDLYRAFHPKTMNFTFFSSSHGTFSRIDHILHHKSSLDNFFKK